MNIRYRPAVLLQLDRIYAHIALENPPAATKVIATIKSSIDRLGLFPYCGRASEIAGIRELPVVRYPYLVFYSVDDKVNEVLILRVRHTSQDPAQHLDQL